MINIPWHLQQTKNVRALKYYIIISMTNGKVLAMGSYAPCLIQFKYEKTKLSKQLCILTIKSHVCERSSKLLYNLGEDNFNSNFNCRKGEMLVSKIYILGYLTFKMFGKRSYNLYLLFLQNAVIEAVAKLK